MRVLICGGGVIGTSVAYFLAQRGIGATVIERCELACGASGKSGGFLALDWCDGTPLEPLARRSFALHGELAERLDGSRWGYRRLETLGVLTSGKRDVSRFRRLDSPEWLAPDAAVHGVLGTAETTAQIDSAAFTRAMMDEALRAGARLVTGAVTGLLRGPEGAVTGVRLDGETLAGDAVVVAMGPWSVLASRWLPLPRVAGDKGHSMVLRYTPPGDGRVLFVELEGEDGRRASPEVVPRPDGTTYVCGLSDDEPLPLDPARVGTSPAATRTLRRITGQFAPDLAAAETVASGACYRPVTLDGLPLVGRIPDVAGAFVATGHGVWGMLNAPGTGEAMAELIAEGETKTLDLSAFDPARLPPLDPAAVSEVGPAS